jgi:hypothetical protein
VTRPCKRCGKAVPYSGRGRPAEYCGDYCWRMAKAKREARYRAALAPRIAAAVRMLERAGEPGYVLEVDDVISTLEGRL